MPAGNKLFSKKALQIPLDKGCKLKVHKTFRRFPYVCSIYILCPGKGIEGNKFAVKCLLFHIEIIVNSVNLPSVIST